MFRNPIERQRQMYDKSCDVLTENLLLAQIFATSHSVALRNWKKSATHVLLSIFLRLAVLLLLRRSFVSFAGRNEWMRETNVNISLIFMELLWISAVISEESAQRVMIKITFSRLLLFTTTHGIANPFQIQFQVAAIKLILTRLRSFGEAGKEEFCRQTASNRSSITQLLCDEKHCAAISKCWWHDSIKVSHERSEQQKKGLLIYMATKEKEKIFIAGRRNDPDNKKLIIRL